MASLPSKSPVAACLCLLNPIVRHLNGARFSTCKKPTHKDTTAGQKGGRSFSSLPATGGNREVNDLGDQCQVFPMYRVNLN